MSLQGMLLLLQRRNSKLHLMFLMLRHRHRFLGPVRHLRNARTKGTAVLTSVHHAQCGYVLDAQWSHVRNLSSLN